MNSNWTKIGEYSFVVNQSEFNYLKSNRKVSAYLKESDIDFKPGAIIKVAEEDKSKTIPELGKENIVNTNRDGEILQFKITFIEKQPEGGIINLKRMK